MNKNVKLFLTGLCSILILADYSAAQQIRMPAPSPLATFEQRVGLTDIAITYSRPGVKGRVIFGDLVPYDKLWRTGANMATKIEFSDDVKIEGMDLKAGAYALFTIPGKDSWTIIFNSNYNQGGTGQYKESEDVLRVSVDPEKMEEEVETFTIDINDITDAGANMWILWENTAVPVRIDVDVDDKVMADIERALDPASDAGNYFMAATYYYNTDRDLDKALEWINKSIELGNKRFWVVHLKANILKKKGDCTEAVKAAEESKAMAKEAGNDDYIALNDNLIASCQ
jgi:tetratricopeptide (TPR) repeat protein